MIGRTMRVLLVLLAAAVGLAAGGIVAGEGFGRLAAARTDAARLEARIVRLRDAAVGGSAGSGARAALTAEIAARRARLYDPDEMNPYSFGTLVKGRLSSLGISVLRYQVVEVGGAPFVEFAASGGVRSFIVFLRDVSRNEKAWFIPSLSLTMREGTDRADAIIKVGYATAGAAGR
jgi:hypothetical protein